MRAVVLMLAALSLLAVGCASEPQQSASSTPTLQVPGEGILPLPPAFTAVPATTASNSAPAAGNAPSVFVGAIMSRTGWLNVVDAAALAAIEAQVEIVNQTGGINGVPLRLEVVDIASDLNEAFQGARRMVRDEAAAVFVSCDQEFALPAVQETLSSIVTAIPCPVSQWWQRDNVFTFGLSPETEGRALALQVQEGLGLVRLWSFPTQTAATPKGSAGSSCSHFRGQGEWCVKS